MFAEATSTGVLELGITELDAAPAFVENGQKASVWGGRVAKAIARPTNPNMRNCLLNIIGKQGNSGVSEHTRMVYILRI